MKAPVRLSAGRRSIRLDEGTLALAQSRYRELGFERVGDLVAHALEDYLRRQEQQAKLARMSEAAWDTRYQAAVHEVGRECRQLDAENLPPEYD